MSSQRYRKMELWIYNNGTTTNSIKEGIDAIILEDEQAIEESIRCYFKKQNTLLKESNEIIGVFAQEQEEALSVIGSAEWIIITTNGRACMILLENVLSAAHLAGNKVAAIVRINDDIRGAAFALDIGVDAIVLPNNYSQELWEAAAIAKAQRAERLVNNDEYKFETKRSAKLDHAIIQRIEPASVLADRVAIDLVRLLSPGEGALVGSSSKALALIHAETLPSSLVAPRPFRINAGPIHSYILMADGTTKYLSELLPGDHIAIVHAQRKGETRSVAIGRLKIETRPHLRVDFTQHSEHSTDVNEFQVFLQHAETVRLLALDSTSQNTTPQIVATSITMLKPGDIFLASFSGALFGTLWLFNTRARC